MYGSDAGGGLRRAELEASADLVEGTDVGVDLDAWVVVQGGPGPLEPGEFAPSHPGVRGGDDEESVVGRDSSGDGVDFVGAGVGPFAALAEGEPQLPARVGADESFVDCFAENHGEQDDDVLDALVGQRRAERLVDPALDQDALDVAECGAGPAGLGSRRSRRLRTTTARSGDGLVGRLTVSTRSSNTP